MEKGNIAGYVCERDQLTHIEFLDLFKNSGKSPSFCISDLHLRYRNPKLDYKTYVWLVPFQLITQASHDKLFPKQEARNLR